MTANTQNINAKSVAKYLILPGIIPRAKEFAGTGFGYIAFLFARVYAAVRLLPPTHSYLDPANIGKFTIIQTIAAAANNLKFDKRNIDQFVVFGTLLTGLVLMVMQFVLLILAFISGEAFAQAQFTTMFETQNPGTDIAFLLLDYVFGLPAIGGAGGESFFGSNALQATGGPTPFQLGMHELFRFYNLAMLLIGVVIFCYHVFVVVIETAQTGVPFGRRFSKLYAPFRLVMAIGLLIPLNYGFNTAQYITLMAAKLGSSFATNGWLLYNENLTDLNPLGATNRSLVARPRQPYVDDLLYFSSVYHSCRYLYWAMAPKGMFGNQRTCIGAYVIVDGTAQTFAAPMGDGCGAAGGANFDYAAAKASLAANGGGWGSGDIEVVLGELDPATHRTAAGGVEPYCGKITIPLGHNNPSYYTGAQDGGVAAIEAAYYNLVRTLLSGDNAYALFRQLGERSAAFEMPREYHDACLHSGALGDGGVCGRGGDWAPPSAIFQTALNNYKTTLNTTVQTAYEALIAGIDFSITEEQQERGWGGAGIWYNLVADLNGVFTGALYATPNVRDYPKIMTAVKNARSEDDRTPDYCGTFEPNLADNMSVPLPSYGLTFARAMNKSFRYFCDRPNQETGAVGAGAGLPAAAANSVACSVAPATQGTTTKGASSNVFIDVVSLIFGLNGLFDLKACSVADPATGQPIVHPLAQLSAIGKSLIENAIRSMGMALGASFGGGILGVLAPALGGALQALSGMFVGIATIGLTIGFILYYILPFLPFIYFFFAVGAWVKSIFEAMVGVPLWALAHLHIDGDGLPGKAAMPGYWLIFEIFLRPIVTIFGLIGGMACFTALVAALNTLFDIVVENSTGSSPGTDTTELTVGEMHALRAGTIDQFFYTIMYAILVYMMATASFKMIDTIPKAFMRWINTGISTFNDNKGDPTSDLTTYAAVGGARASSQIFGGLQQGVGGWGQAIGAGIQTARNAGNTGGGGNSGGGAAGGG